MKVDAYLKVDQMYQVSKQNKIEKKEKNVLSDKVEISSKGRDYQVAKQALKDIPEIREDRVNRIKSALAAGTYQVSMEEVADKLIEGYV